MTAASFGHAGYRLSLVTVGPFLSSVSFSVSSLAGASWSLSLSKNPPVLTLAFYFSGGLLGSFPPIVPS